MANQALHIVTHDVPWPVSHGGLVDLFYKIKALHQQGVAIHLHCFTQGRAPQAELEQYCACVNYYPRQKTIGRFSWKIPFIVNSRQSDELIANLQKDDHPILLEGIHTTYYLYKGALQNRKVLVRLHNAEFEYYRQLAGLEKNPLKKFYYTHESRLLKRYEKKIAAGTTLLAVSEQDIDIYQREFAAKDIHLLPVFLPNKAVTGREGKGCFCLYHGNLSVNENEAAATWLLENVFTSPDLPFVIAGKDPSKKLQELAHKHPHTCMVVNPSEQEMQDLIAKAQVNVLPSFNSTGIKLKLLNAVFSGRHCLVNPAAVKGSGLEACCHIAEGAPAFKQQLQTLYQQAFTEEEITKRQQLLLSLFNNEENAKRLIQFL